MLNAGRLNGRALEMLKSGEGVDCVIEVESNDAHRPGKFAKPFHRVKSKQNMLAEHSKNKFPNMLVACQTYSASLPTVFESFPNMAKKTYWPAKQTEFHVHKFVLMRHSQVFSALFRDKTMKEFQKFRIQINDSTPAAVRQMLTYMYTGNLPENYDIERGADLMKIANKYQIKPLMELNKQIMIGSSSSQSPFMLLAMKTSKQRFHDYKHGEHNNHPSSSYTPMNLKNFSKGKQPAARQQQQNIHEEVILKKEEEEEDLLLIADEQVQRQSESIVPVEHAQEEDDEEERECVISMDIEIEITEDEEEPLRKITKKVMGHKRQYYFLETVKSVEELDRTRFTNYCQFVQGKPLKILRSYIMPCSWKKTGKLCDFELLALPSKINKGKIHVYAFSEHNHVFNPEERKANYNRKEKELMPAQNPPMTLGIMENVWKFVQTFPNYQEIKQFLLENKCTSKYRSSYNTGKWWQIRFSCNHRMSHNCPFVLMAIKTTEEGYHVYKDGEHNHHPHPVNMPAEIRILQPAARCHRIVEAKEQEDDDDHCYVVAHNKRIKLYL